MTKVLVLLPSGMAVEGRVGGREGVGGGSVPGMPREGVGGGGAQPQGCPEGKAFDL